MRFLGKVFGIKAEVDNGNSSATKTVTMAAGNKQKLTLTAACALTIDWTGAPVGSYQLRVIQNSTGGFAITWTAGVSASRWLGSASAPAINTASNGETLVSFFYDGTNAVQSLAKVGAA